MNITDELRSVAYTYTYDFLHRLLVETPSGGQTITYQYNAIGNITSRQAGSNSFTYTYDTSHKHAVKTINLNGNNYTFSYDANGNMTTGYDFTDPAQVANRAISYTADNMPAQVQYTKGGSTVTTDFLYDGNCRRWKKAVQGGSTTYYIGDHYEKTGGVATLYVFAGDMRIAKITGASKYYFHKDHLGSSAKTSDQNGVCVETTEYMPFGSMREHSGSVISNYKYTDQELDPETGLYFYGARYYDPLIGRFISPDSIVPDPADPQGLNRYSYCRNNPLIYTDPTGQIAIVDDILIGAAVGAIIGGTMAAVTGNNIGQGMMMGAVSGASLGLGAGVVGGAGLGTYSSAGVYAAAGAGGGAANASLFGGNMGQAMVCGGVMGLAGALIPTPAFQPFGSSATASIGNRVFNSALAGAGFGGAYASFRGDNIGQGMAMGAAAWAIGESVNMAIGHGVGYLASGKAPTFEDGVFIYDAQTEGWITFGNVVTGPTKALNESYVVSGKEHTYKQHELGHMPQGTLLGPAYIPAHAASLTIGGTVGVTTGTGFINGTHQYGLFERYYHPTPAY